MPFDDERSPLWGITAGAALAGSAGYAGYVHRNAFARAWKTGAIDVTKKATSLTETMPGFNVGAVLSDAVVADETIRAALVSMEKGFGLSATIGDIHTAAYEAIMAGGKKSHEEALGVLTKINQQGSATDAYSAAIDAVTVASGKSTLFESRLGEFTSDILKRNRAFVQAGAVTSEGGIGGVIAGAADFSKLSASAKREALAIQENLGVVAKGKFDIDWDYKIIEDLIGGQKVTTPMMIGEVSGIRLAEIPLASTGYTYSGANLTSRYITRGAYRGTGEKIKYAELYQRTVGDAISRARNNTQLKQNLLSAHRTLIEEMGARDSAARAAAVWTGPFVTSGGAAKARLIGMEAIGYGVPQEDVVNLIGRGAGLYPYTSPGAAGKGVLSTQNLAEELFGPLGSLMSAEQRPTQFVRGEWGVTREAKAAAEGFGGTFGGAYNRLGRKGATEFYKKNIYGGMPVTSARAYSVPQLITFYAKPSTKGYGLGYQASALNKMMAAEEGVISARVTDMMEYERIVQKKISFDEGMRINKGLMTELKGRKIGDIPLELEGVLPKGFVGIERGTGAEVAGEIIGAEVSGPNQATVFMRERKKLSENEMWKFFSEENKFMAAAADKRRMARVLEAAGAGDIADITGQGVEAVFSGKLVGRNQMALITQQTEAISMFLGKQLDMGALQMTPEIQAFLDNPSAALDVSGIIRRNSSNAAFEIQKNLMGMAKGWGFQQREMQLTFGLASRETLMGAARAGVIDWRTAGHIARAPGVVGLGKGMLGDIATEGGAGRWGSFEQTGFRALSMKGEVGERYAVELSKRIAGKGELGAADVMMSTMLGQEGIMARFGRDVGSLEKLADIAPADLIQSEGRFVSLGRRFDAFGGSNVLYIPGLNEAPTMVGDVVAKGKRVNAPLTSELLSFRNLLKRGKVSGDELELAAANLRTLGLQTAEAQAAARGKVIGSKVLTGMRKTFEKDADVFRISGEMGEQMFEDLIGRAESESQLNFLKQQRAAFREGQIMTGGMWRHPTTGPESFQFVKFKKDAQLANGMVAAPTQYGKLHFQDKNIPVDVSAMVGFKGDFDRDQFVLSLISDERTNSMARRSINNQQRIAYSQYLFNHYSMKNVIEGKASKGAQLSVLSDDALRQGYRKLSTVKTTTGQVNIALQKLKIGLRATAPGEYRPMAELFWHLEEAAIGGRHGILEGDLYQAIAQSVEEGGEKGIKRMEGVLKTLMGGETRTLSGTITDAYGVTRQHSLHYDPRQWAETAIASYDTVSQDVDISMRAVAAARGKDIGDISLNQAVEMYHARRTGSIDFAQALMQANADNVDNFTLKTSRLMRQGGARARGIMNVIKRAKKPLLAGVGIATGVMLMAPAVSGTIGGGPEGPNAGRGMIPDDYGPPGSQGINPPLPGMNASPRLYDIGGGKMTSRANIRMRINDLDSSSRDFMRSARQVSDGGRVNIRTKDDRSILDPRMLANKIHERL